jgi:uncharacterized protein
MTIFQPKIWTTVLIVFILCFSNCKITAQSRTSTFNVITFYSLRNDQAHITFVHEANKWFHAAATKYNFTYDSTNNWDNLNAEFLSHYQVVLFLDSRPEVPAQREAFQKYMESGGGWIGFHFAGFALNDSEVQQNWDWYHNTFLGVGEFKSNTWRPTSAILRVEDQKHPVTKHMPQTFTSAPSEWYRWDNDIRTNTDIKILLSVDPSSFPLGTGPKPDEIWHEGYYPIAWTNKNYNMLYVNMGHNDIDYENKTNRQLSSSFSSDLQNTLIIDALQWLGTKKQTGKRN